MSDQFLHLSVEERGEIIDYTARQRNLAREFVEKDVFVCWGLQTLFTMPDAHPMAFKGGTSLSKVYGAINRFSEDVDVTLDYRAFDDDFNPFAEGTSKGAIRKYSDRLKGYVKEYAYEVVAPYIESKLHELPNQQEYSINISGDGEKIWVLYPSVVKEGSDYIKRHILIELGGRNVIDPNEIHVVAPDAAFVVDSVDFPSAEVVVLSPQRTFWEKATLIHVECNRKQLKANPARMSRHWYDMVKLAQHKVGQEAISNRTLLEDVVNHKQVFFYCSYANYEACLDGELQMTPSGELLDELRVDYTEMLKANMMYDEPPSFDEIMEQTASLEHAINSW